MVTNVRGLGHLTRGLAIARKLQALSSNYQVIFIGTAWVTELIREQGFMYFYIAPKEVLPETVTQQEWMTYFQESLESIINFYKPKVVIYDGVCPHRVLIEQLKKHNYLKLIWVKRENYKERFKGLEFYKKEFDLVILPREVGAIEELKDKKGNEKYCLPITLLDQEEAHERNKVRRALAIKDNEYLYYIQLGEGEINRIDYLIKRIQEEIISRGNTRILLAQSPIGKKVIPINDKVRVIKNYPNAQYFKGVDFAVAAAGYNTFHELVQFKVPSLFIPNYNTVVDDQLLRARRLEEQGAVLVLRSIDTLSSKLDELENRQLELKKQLQGYQTLNGAIEAAKFIHELIRKE